LVGIFVPSDFIPFFLKGVKEFANYIYFYILPGLTETVRRTKESVLSIFSLLVVITTGVQVGPVNEQNVYAETGTSGDDNIITGS
jgi:hypothetical protein